MTEGGSAGVSRVLVRFRIIPGTCTGQHRLATTLIAVWGLDEGGVQNVPALVDRFDRFNNMALYF